RFLHQVAEPCRGGARVDDDDLVAAQQTAAGRLRVGIRLAEALRVGQHDDLVRCAAQVLVDVLERADRRRADTHPGVVLAHPAQDAFGVDIDAVPQRIGPEVDLQRDDGYIVILDEAGIFEAGGTVRDDSNPRQLAPTFPYGLPARY